MSSNSSAPPESFGLPGTVAAPQGAWTRAGDGTVALAVDGAVIVAVSAALCIAAQHVYFMTVFVPAVLVARFVAWSRLPAAERGRSLAAEVAFYALCTVAGAANDYSSVVRHHIYDYAVPHELEASSVPVWMLLYWGVILRFLGTLYGWKRLFPDPSPRDVVWWGGVPRSGPRLKIAFLLALAVITRQAIYRCYLHPVASWLPFAAALALYALVVRPDRDERRLMLLFAIGGPLTEILYIQVGGLHRYHLGWLCGVPLWIALWWVLAALIWRDLSARILRRLSWPASDSR